MLWWGCKEAKNEYETLEQVQGALRKAGLESCNLIVGIDFTASNKRSGANTFNGRSLHEISSLYLNLYEQALSVIAKTLASFQDNNLIPVYGFGDVTTQDKHVFDFFEDGRPCHGLDEALDRYRKLARCAILGGPTSFVPVIEMAIKTVEESGGQYRVLLIIADGQVTQQAQTLEAIRKASNYALSIVLVGVGDGPWKLMERFDNSIEGRKFDNFQFLNFSKIIYGQSWFDKMLNKSLSIEKREAMFAVNALKKIPKQYQATVELQLMGKTSGPCTYPYWKALPPPRNPLASPVPSKQIAWGQ